MDNLRYEDITGQKYGTLTAIEHIGQGLWLCHCDCGEEVIVNKTKLKNRKVMGCASCGIKRKGFKKTFKKNFKKDMDLTGKQFGDWLVLGVSHTAHSGKYWHCRCKCGTESVVNGYALLNGKSHRCQTCGNKKGALTLHGGDFKKDMDLTGKQFGDWLVLGFSHTKYNGKYWHCRCKCGAEHDVNVYSLLNGTSCGCRKCGSKKLTSTLRKNCGDEENNITLDFDKAPNLPATVTAPLAQDYYASKAELNIAAEDELNRVLNELKQLECGEFYNFENIRDSIPERFHEKFKSIVAKENDARQLEYFEKAAVLAKKFLDLFKEVQANDKK